MTKLKNLSLIRDGKNILFFLEGADRLLTEKPIISNIGRGINPNDVVIKEQLDEIAGGGGGGASTFAELTGDPTDNAALSVLLGPPIQALGVDLQSITDTVNGVPLSGMSFTPEADSLYVFELFIRPNGNASGGGVFAMTGPAGGTFYAKLQIGTGAATTDNRLFALDTYSSTTFAPGNSDNYWVHINGMFKTSSTVGAFVPLVKGIGTGIEIERLGTYWIIRKIL